MLTSFLLQLSNPPLKGLNLSILYLELSTEGGNSYLNKATDVGLLGISYYYIVIYR